MNYVSKHEVGQLLQVVSSNMNSVMYLLFF